jgi:hypothetical protein
MSLLVITVEIFVVVKEYVIKRQVYVTVNLVIVVLHAISAMFPFPLFPVPILLPPQTVAHNALIKVAHYYYHVVGV